MASIFLVMDRDDNPNIYGAFSTKEKAIECCGGKPELFHIAEFELDVEKPRKFADRYSVALDVDGKEYSNYTGVMKDQDITDTKGRNMSYSSTTTTGDNKYIPNPLFYGVSWRSREEAERLAKEELAKYKNLK